MKPTRVKTPPPPPPPAVNVTVERDRLRVYIDGLLHLSIAVEEIVAVQAWKYGEDRFDIEYTLKTTHVATWYDRRDLWEAVLKGLRAIGRI